MLWLMIITWCVLEIKEAQKCDFWYGCWASRANWWEQTELHEVWSALPSLWFFLVCNCRRVPRTKVRAKILSWMFIFWFSWHQWQLKCRVWAKEAQVAVTKTVQSTCVGTWAEQALWHELAWQTKGRKTQTWIMETLLMNCGVSLIRSK